VSCPSATNCTAVGRDGYANETDGTWGPVTEISGFAGGSGVSCTDAKDCTAVGAVGYDGGADGSGEPIYATSQPEPTASILIPSNGATLSGSTYLDAAASDATSVEFRLLGGPYGLNAPAICTATPTLYGWLCSWNTDTVPNGSYILESEASNSAGSTFSSGVGITVKNPLPTTSVLIPSIGATLSGSTYLDASASNATSVEYWILGGSFGFTGKLIGIATPTIYGWLCPWNTTMVPDGSYVLVSEAFNTAGSSFSSWVGITVKN
jgi:hypothetical protein